MVRGWGAKSPHSLFWTDEKPLLGSRQKSTAKNKAIISRQQQFALAGDGQCDLIVPFISNFYDSVFQAFHSSLNPILLHTEPASPRV